MSMPNQDRRMMRRRSIDVVQPNNYSPLLPHRVRQQRSHSIMPTADVLAHFKQVTPASSNGSLKSRSTQQSREDVSSNDTSPMLARRSCLRRGSLGANALPTHWSSEISSRDLLKYRERPKTAFGSSLSTNVKPSPKLSRKKTKTGIDVPAEKTSNSDETQGDDAEPIRADDFINNCIIDSQTPRIKPPLRPKTSSLFSQLLDEFIPGSNDKETPEMIEIAVTPRGRSNSFTAFQLHKPKLQINSTAEQLEAV